MECKGIVEIKFILTLELQKYCINLKIKYFSIAKQLEGLDLCIV